MSSASPKMAKNCRPPLHIYFIPLLAPGHMIPLVEMARQISRHKAKATILLTNLHAAQFSSLIERDKHHHGLDINIRQIKFPNVQVGLPENCESLSSVTTSEMALKFDKALSLLQEPAIELLKQDKADCIVSDFFVPWTTQVAEKLGIPRLIFQATGFFPLCVYHSLITHKPFIGIHSDSETFTVPELPHVIKMSKRQIPDFVTQESINSALVVYCDNASAKHLASNPIFHERTKHIEIELHFVREHVARKHLRLLPISSSLPLADIFTKAVA